MDDRIEQGLSQIRDRRRLCWLLVLGWLPAATIGIVGLRVAGMNDAQASLLVGPPYALIFALAVYRAQNALCPKCNQRFHSLGPLRRQNPWTRECLHCGLPLQSQDR